MIHTEEYSTRADGVKLYRTYSDENRYIRQEQTGAVYAEAIDVEGSEYAYTETDEFLPTDENLATNEAPEHNDDESEG